MKSERFENKPSNLITGLRLNYKEIEVKAIDRLIADNPGLVPNRYMDLVDINECKAVYKDGIIVEARNPTVVNALLYELILEAMAEHNGTVFYDTYLDYLYDVADMTPEEFEKHQQNQAKEQEAIRNEWSDVEETDADW